MILIVGMDGGEEFLTIQIVSDDTVSITQVYLKVNQIIPQEYKITPE